MKWNLFLGLIEDSNFEITITEMWSGLSTAISAKNNTIFIGLQFINSTLNWKRERYGQGTCLDLGLLFIHHFVLHQINLIRISVGETNIIKLCAQRMNN